MTELTVHHHRTLWHYVPGLALSALITGAALWGGSIPAIAGAGFGGLCREGSEDWISLAQALGTFTATPAGGGESVLPSAAHTVINTLPQSRQTPGSQLNVQHAARQFSESW